MKKFILVFTIISLILFSTACSQKDNFDSMMGETSNKFDIVETKNIILGNNVDSVTFTTSTGEKVTFDNSAKFYDIFDKIGFDQLKGDKKYSCCAQTKIADQSKSFINMNAYRFNGAELYDYRTKKEADDAIAEIEEFYYSKPLENNNMIINSFNRYTYKDELAFYGYINEGNGNTQTYSSDNYPQMPEMDTELCEMYSRSHFLSNLIFSIEFFKNHETYVIGDKQHDLNALINREYKLYKNYIVFKQTAPFLIVFSPEQLGHNLEAVINLFKSSNYSISQEAYFNIKTGEIELIKIYGNTISHSPANYCDELNADIEIYIHNITEAESKQKVDSLINYVKSKAN